MHLWEALHVQRGDVVSFVGAGGKTTAMYRLGRELAELGWRVITTTTTMIRPPAAHQTDVLLVEEQAEQALCRVDEALQRWRRVTLASQRLAAEDKLKGVDPTLVAQLVPLCDAILVEADGARGLSLKAPAAYEPVVPAATKLLIPVVGIDAVGRRLTEEAAHRPKLIAQLTGLACGEVITSSAVACLLLHPQGALKGAPAGARIVPLINKVQDEATLALARQVAAQVKGNSSIDRILIGAVASDDPLIECWRRVAAIVLAAGASTRFGCPKQLLPIAESTMLEHVLRTVMSAPVDETIVVLGSAAAQIAEHVPAGCRTVWNADWEMGISSSVRAGLEAISPKAEAALFVQADQPNLTRTALERILQAYYGTTKAIVVPTCQGQRGTPVLFDRRLFAELSALRGDVGGREVIARFADQVLPAEIQSPDVFVDIDTPADYERFLKRQGKLT